MLYIFLLSSILIQFCFVDCRFLVLFLKIVTFFLKVAEFYYNI
jgi:hypothetical protein